jgi:WD40 repeat protein
MAERENGMKQHKLFQVLIILLLSPTWLSACSFSVEVLTTPTSAPPTFTPPALSETLVPLTLAVPSATPTLVSIRADTLNWLQSYQAVRHGDIVHSLAFSPDSMVLASAGGQSEDFSIHLSNVVNGQLVGTLNGHTDSIWGIAFSPDGTMLASASSDKTAKIWDWRNGTLLKSLDFPSEVVSVSFSPDGQTLAVGGVDEPVNQIRNAAIWTYRVGSWETLVKYPEYWNIAAMAYSPNGDMLVGGGTSRNVQVWRAGDSDPIFTLNHAHQVGRAAISPDGSVVATATCETVVNQECTDGAVWLWDLPSGRLLKKLTGFPEIVVDVAFSVDGSILIAASRSGLLRFYSTADYQLSTDATATGRPITLTLSPDGRLLATGNTDGDVDLWKIVYPP